MYKTYLYIIENLVTQMLRQEPIPGVQGLLLYIGLRRRILKHVPVRYGRLLSFLPFQSLLYFLLLVLLDWSLEIRLLSVSTNQWSFVFPQLLFATKRGLLTPKSTIYITTIQSQNFQKLIFFYRFHHHQNSFVAFFEWAQPVPIIILLFIQHIFYCSIKWRLHL